MSTTLDFKDYQFIQENGMMIENSMMFVKGLKIIHQPVRVRLLFCIFAK